MFQSVEELDDYITRPSDQLINSLANAPRDFVILGAGGKMGYHTARMLQRALAKISRNDRLLVVSRFETPHSCRPFQDLGVDILKSDLTQRAEVRKLPQAGNVLFLAGMKFGTSHNPQMLEDFNVRMPTMIAEHYSQSRIVALSTGNVYSYVEINSGGATETSPTIPVGEYGRSCLGRERAFQEMSLRYGNPSAILRLNYSVSLRYGVTTDIATKVLYKQAVNLEMGYVNIIWQGDAVAHTLLALEQARSPAHIMNIAGPEILSVRELAEYFAVHFNKPLDFKGSESPTALLSNASHSHQLFGHPTITSDSILLWTVDWLDHNLPLLNKPTHFESRAGNF